MLGRILKLSSSARNRGQVHEQRLFSTASTPYLLLRNNKASIDCFDPRKRETVKIPEQSVPKEVQESVTIGSSRGWVGLKNIHDSSVRLTNIFNPCASSRKVVSLPPLDDTCSKAGVSNMSLSASPEEEGGDCVVAVKFYSPALGLALCRPGDSEWTYIQTPEAPSVSKVMYSVKDQKFYLNTCSGLTTTSSDFPPVNPYPRFRAYQGTGLLILSFYSIPYFVETPSGEPLLVFWFKEIFDPFWSKTKDVFDYLPDKSSRNTKSFIVHDLRTGYHTRDITSAFSWGTKTRLFASPLTTTLAYAPTPSTLVALTRASASTTSPPKLSMTSPTPTTSPPKLSMTSPTPPLTPSGLPLSTNSVSCFLYPLYYIPTGLSCLSFVLMCY